MDENYLYSRWSPGMMSMSKPQIPFGEWHVRLHRINSARTLQAVEGGFAVMKTEHHIHERGCYLTASNGSSVIVDLSPAIAREPDSIVTPPNSSIMFPECASIPLLKPISLRERALLRRRGQRETPAALAPELKMTLTVAIREPGGERKLSFTL